MTGLALWTDAQALMDVCVAALDSLPDDDAALLGAPDRQLFTDGLPQYSGCDQISIFVTASGELPTTTGNVSPSPSLNRVRFGRVNVPSYAISAVRCRPTALSDQEEPSPAAYAIAAKQHMADVWALWNGIYRAFVNGMLFSKCDGITMEVAVADDPSGGVSGWVLIVTVPTDGYDPIPDYVPPDLSGS